MDQSDDETYKPGNHMSWMHLDYAMLVDGIKEKTWKHTCVWSNMMSWLWTHEQVYKQAKQ